MKNNDEIDVCGHIDKDRDYFLFVMFFRRGANVLGPLCLQMLIKNENNNDDISIHVSGF